MRRPASNDTNVSNATVDSHIHTVDPYVTYTASLLSEHLTLGWCQKAKTNPEWLGIENKVVYLTYHFQTTATPYALGLSRFVQSFPLSIHYRRSVGQCLRFDKSDTVPIVSFVGCRGTAALDNVL